MTSFRITRRTVLALALACALGSSPARAGACDPGATDPAHIREREAMLADGFRVGRETAGLWAGIWGWTWVVATGGQLALGLGAPSNIQEDRLVGAIGTAFGLVPTFLLPPYIVSDAPFEPKDGSCEELAAAEERLAHYAWDDHRRTAWYAYAIGLGLNLARAAVLGPGFGHWGAAAFTLAAGIPLGAIMTYTYPAPGLRLKARYDGDAPSGGGGRLGASPLLTGDGGGVMLSLSF